MRKMTWLTVAALLWSAACRNVAAQSAPAVVENIPWLMTFGANSLTSWGDDDFCQIFFCVIPASQKSPFYIRVYDPETGGSLDECKGTFNSAIRFSVYGGPGCWSDTAAQSIHPTGNFKSGYLLSAKTFTDEKSYDRQWYTFGPFNPSEGEFVSLLNGRVFKIIAQGVSGDDGNIYTYFLSSAKSENIPLEGGNMFTYKYHFRLSDDPKHVCQIYPFIDDKTVSVEIMNFDWDNDGIIRIFSIAKNGVPCDVSKDNNWVVRKFPILTEEKNSSLQIQFVKNQTVQVRNNNVVVCVRNQYGTSLPFFVLPIGGVPVYSPKIRIK